MNAALLLCVALAGGGPSEFPNFDTEVMPLLTKSGCNAGACHGAAAGRGGFHLSLLGSDPAADYQAIVHAFEGRRINLAKPELSLILAKPTGRMPHGGDVALPEGEPGEQLLRRWIEAGAPRGRPRKLTDFQVVAIPTSHDRFPRGLQLRATASFDGEPAEDVTPWTLFSAGDKDAIVIDHEQSSAHIQRRGQHVILARFLNRVVPLQINVPLGAMPVDFARQPRANFIDDEILSLLSTLRIPAAPQADDATFLRRVRLDLTGRLPSTEETLAFLEQTQPDRRLRLVDSLLASEDFIDYWTLRFARHLNVHGLPNESAGVTAYTKWLRHQIAVGTPLNLMARELITATGDAHEVGPANFGRMVVDARSHAELFGRFFIGARLGCANCHNHPLDKWTQDDYHGLASVFARLERGRNVQIAARGSVTNLRTGEPATPRIPGVRDLDPLAENLSEVADWISSPHETAFARATVNRLWQAMFGRGLVEPIDDLRETNPPTHPRLFDRLARDFIENQFNMRHTLRLIATSQAYGHSDRGVSSDGIDDRFYSRAVMRPLLPEVLADAIADVTGVPNRFEGHEPGMRAVRLVDPLSKAPALDTLGRCSRLESACDEISGTTIGVATQLHLINGQLVNDKLTDPQGVLNRMIAAHKSTAEIVTEFYLRAFAKPPTDVELAKWCERLESEQPAEREERLQDFVWSVLNSSQFMNNH